MSPAPAPFWFGPADRPLLGWHHAPSGTKRRAAVVLCAPFGHEYMVSYRSYRNLAERLAAAGFDAFRFDYDGTGDAAGDSGDPNRVAAWQESLRAAIAAAKGRAATETVALFGVRLGALLAASVAAEGDVHALALVGPVASGRAYVRELQAFRRLHESGGAEDEIAGYALTPETRTALWSLSFAALTTAPAAVALVIGRDDFAGSETPVVQALEALGTSVKTSATGGYAKLMVDDAYKAETPEALWSEVTTWLGLEIKGGVASGNGGSTSGASTAVRMGAVTERVVQFAGLVGILTEPAVPSRAPPVILTNVGANHRVGTHRLYVSLARGLAARGCRVLRYDRAGLGDSPAAPGGAERVVYAPAGAANVRAAIDLVEQEYGTGVGCTLVGLCSGAYFSYHAAATDPRARGVVLINPLTFAWREGDSLSTKRRGEVKASGFYARALRNPAIWQRLSRGEVDLAAIGHALLRRIGARLRYVVRRLSFRGGQTDRRLSEVARTFRAFAARQMDTLIVCSADDAGMDLIAEHLGPGAALLRGRPRFKMEVVHGTDHTFTPRWSQAHLIELVGARLEAQHGL